MTSATETFEGWLQRSAPGDAFTYYVGFLAVDRDKRRSGPWVDELARRAMREQSAGWVFLTQKRLAPGVFAYYATKRRQRSKRRYHL